MGCPSDSMLCCLCNPLQRLFKSQNPRASYPGANASPPRPDETCLRHVVGDTVASPVPSLSDLTEDFRDLRNHPEDAARLRTLYAKLIERLPAVAGPDETRESFFVTLFYKNMIGDLLRNCIEDDYVSAGWVTSVITNLADTWEPASKLDVPEARDLWLQQVLEFSAHYRTLPLHRHRGATATVNGVKFFVASEDDPLLGLPIRPEPQG